jgi:hypothetical protein
MTTQIVIQVPLTEEEMDEYIGTECEEYQEGCPICDTWIEWEEYDGVVSVMVDKDKLVNWILMGEGL